MATTRKPLDATPEEPKPNIPPSKPIYPNVQGAGKVRYQQTLIPAFFPSTKPALSESDSDSEPEVDVEGGSVPVSYQLKSGPKT